MHPSRALTPEVLASAYGAGVNPIAHDHAPHAAPPPGVERR
jgi:hypothetical protein